MATGVRDLPGPPARKLQYRSKGLTLVVVLGAAMLVCFASGCKIGGAFILGNFRSNCRPSSCIDRRSRGGGGEITPATLTSSKVKFAVNASVGLFVRVVYSPATGLMLCSGDWTGNVTGLDPASGKAQFTSIDMGVDSINSLSFTPDAGAMLCGSGWTGNISAFEPATQMKRFVADPGVGEYVRSAFAKNTGLVLFAGGGTKPNVAGVDPVTGEVRFMVDPGIGAIWTIICVEDGPAICGGSWSRPDPLGKVVGLDTATGDVLYTIKPGVGKYVCLSHEPETGAVLCGGENGNVAAINPSSGEVKYTTNASIGEVWSIVPAANAGVVLCGGGWTGLVSGLNPHTGEVLYTVNATIGKIFSMIYVEELGVAICGGDQGKIAGIEPKTGTVAFVTETHINEDVTLGEIWSLAHVPGTGLVYAAGNNATIMVLSV